MKRLIFTLMGISLFSFSALAQVPVPNGGFENWSTEDLLISFPPFSSITNLASLAEDESPNVYPVSTSSGGIAVRLAPNLVDSSVLVAAMGIGEFNPHKPGAAFSGRPDALHLRLRYHILPGDNSLIALNFFREGNLLAGPHIVAFTGIDSLWHEETSSLPFLAEDADSIGILIAAGDFNNSQLGTWMEIDSAWFSGTSDPFPNGNFSQTDSVSYLNPDGWFTFNRLSSLLAVPPTVIRSEMAAVGNYAVEIQTSAVEIDGSIDTSGFLFFAREVGDMGPMGNHPIPIGASQTKGLTGLYAYQAVGNDTAVAYLLMTRYDVALQKRDTLFQNALLLPETIGYQPFYLPVELSAPADSFLLAFGSSDVNGDFHSGQVGIGSSLLLDELYFDTTTTTTSINPVLNALDIQVFPNPAREILNISLPNQPQFHQLALRDIQGKVIHTQILKPSPSRELQLDTRRFTRGIYVLSLSDDQGNTLYRTKVSLR